MLFRGTFRAVTPVLLTLCVVTAPAFGQRQIQFRAEFTPTGAPAPGWAYLWNQDGPVWNPANFSALPQNYKPLFRDTSGNWETAANGAYPDPAPANGLRVSALGAVPGAGSTQDPNERFAIVAYTIQPSDVAAVGSTGAVSATLTDYTFGSVFSPNGTGVNPAIFVNSAAVIPPGALNLPPGFTYDRSLPDAYDVPLGTLVAGDTIYVAIGSGLTDTGDALNMDFTVTLTPEPGAMTLAALAAAALCGRRRAPRPAGGVC